MNTNKQPTFYTPSTLASYLQVSLQTVYNWNSLGTGPAFYAFGNRVRYRPEDVEAWVETKKVA